MILRHGSVEGIECGFWIDVIEEMLVKVLAERISR